MPNYNVWTKHGERWIMLENADEEEDFIPHFEDDYYSVFFKDTTMGSLKKMLKHRLQKMILVRCCEAEEVCETVKESKDLKRMLEDYRTMLYRDCNKGTKSWVTY
jgi:hypothetical protein